jgi:hypothetical protein
MAQLKRNKLKIGVFAIVVCLLTLTTINFYLYKNYRDYGSFSYGPYVPNITTNRELAIAVFSNSNNEKIILQRFFFREKYKYIYFTPTTLAEEYVLVLPTRYFLNKNDSVVALSSSTSINVGGMKDFLNISFIPEKVMINKSEGNLTFSLDTLYSGNIMTKPSISVIDKFSIGPICEGWW